MEMVVLYICIYNILQHKLYDIVLIHPTAFVSIRINGDSLFSSVFVARVILGVLITLEGRCKIGV